MKTSKIFLIVIILIANISFAEIKQIDFTVNLHSEKTNYYTYEPIKINIKIQNFSEVGPLLSKYIIGDYIQITNSAGEEMRCNWHASWYGERMKKSDKFEVDIELNEKFGKDKIGPISFLKPDLYNIQFKYSENIKLEPVVSNMLIISIKDPIDIERYPYIMLKKGMEFRAKRELALSDSIYDKIAEDYPESIYMDRALYFKMLSHKHKQGEKHLKINKDTAELLLKKKPDSKYSAIALGSIIEYYKFKNDKTELRKKIKDLKDKTSVTELKVKLEKVLNNIDTNKYKFKN